MALTFYQILIKTYFVKYYFIYNDIKIVQYIFIKVNLKLESVTFLC